MAHLEGQERADYVQDMFARIAGRYDRMNRLMTFGQDMTWRRYVIAQACLPVNSRLLDIATGTGDIALEGLRQTRGLTAVGGDFTIEMMQAGKRIPERAPILWTAADTLRLPFPNNTFDAVTSGFLMRNVIDVPGAFREQMRVTKPGGRVVVLESSPPKKNLLRPFIKIHLNYVIPTLGKVITGESDAYRYLPDSTQQFKTPEALADIMRQTGLVNIHFKLFMFGTIAIHVGEKPG
jgi:demethylmenaquinone methyltransferase/2-methoxy-6-polyprenyl-1,4-benzoquinol methylase